MRTECDQLVAPGYAKIRELERALGRKTMEVEILRAAKEVKARF